MWSIMLFLVVGMLFVGLVLDLAGTPESVWGPVVGISWLITPLVFIAWLTVTVMRWAGRASVKGPSQSGQG